MVLKFPVAPPAAEATAALTENLSKMQMFSIQPLLTWQLSDGSDAL
jgi:hypothetical protein